jgi:hypothetical protein
MQRRYAKQYWTVAVARVKDDGRRHGWISDIEIERTIVSGDTIVQYGCPHGPVVIQSTSSSIGEADGQV